MSHACKTKELFQEQQTRILEYHVKVQARFYLAKYKFNVYGFHMIKSSSGMVS